MDNRNLMKPAFPVIPIYLMVVGSILLYSIYYFGMYDQLLKDGGDAWGYYIYLPSTLIHQDITTLDSIASIREQISPHTISKDNNNLGFDEVNIAENGNPVIKYTSGVGLMMSPFFLISHFLSLITGKEANGFTNIYWIGHYMGLVFWVLLGIFLLIRLLRRYFDLSTALVTSTAILLATNLFYFSVYNPMAHAPLFSLYCILIYFSDQFYKKPAYLPAILIGASAGLITMIRPVEIIAVIIPFLWGIQSFSSRVQFFRKNIHLLLMAILFFILMGVPQLVYWKMVSDSWLFYSYGEEGFNFLKSRGYRIFFNFRNGWFIYTPVMIFSILGMYHLYKRNKSLLWGILFFLPLHIYITFSWHNWYYINSFGSRPMVETYALLSLPLAAFIHYFKKSLFNQFILSIGLSFFILLNLFQTWQVSQGILLTEEGTKPYYMAAFGKTKMTERILITADTREYQPKPNQLRFIENLKSWHHNEVAIKSDSLHEKNQDNRLMLSSHSMKSIEIDLPTENLKPGDFLKAEIIAISDHWNNNRWNMARSIIAFSRDSKIYHKRWNRINNKLGNPEWSLWGGEPNVSGRAWFFVEIPKDFKTTDDITFIIENKFDQILTVDQYAVSLWKEDLEAAE